MTLRQLEALTRILRLGYATEYEHGRDNGNVYATLRRKLRHGTFTIVVAPDGTYRATEYNYDRKPVRRYA